MSDAQIFQLLGLVFFATGMGMLIDLKFIQKMLDGLKDNEVALYLTGVIALTVGYLIVSLHHVYGFSIRTIITLVGWLALFKGLAILVFSKTVMRMASDAAKNKNCMSIATATILILGVFFLYFGYFLL